MDRNSAIGFVLIAVILGAYTWYTLPSAEEQARLQRQQDSLAALTIEEREREAVREVESGRAEAVVEAATVTSAEDDLLSAADAWLADSLRNAAIKQRFGPFAPAAEGTGEMVTIENERLQVSISTHGARPVVMRLKEYSTYHGTPLFLADPDSGTYEFRFFAGNADISTRDLHFQAERIGPDAVRLIAPTDADGRRLEVTYTLDSTTYFMDVRAAFTGLAGVVDVRSLFFRWDITGLNNEKHLPNELQKSSVYFKYFGDKRDYLSETGEEEKELKGRTNWVAFKQDFFTVAMVSEEGFASSGSTISIEPLESETHTKRFKAKLYFDKKAEADPALAMRFYLGPNHYGTLRRTEVEELHKVIDLGWGIFGWMNRWLVIPIFNFLNQFDLSYGIIILVLTLAIKLLLMPLTYKNLVASAKMRVLKPEMETITAKFKDGDALKKQQATMDLYRKAGVNPASGCVPMLIQLPVLYAMFRFFPSSIELRQEKFLWADDLSSYDSVLDLPFTIPMYGDHVSLFTLLMAASTIVYSLINQNQMPTQQGMPSMKILIWMFPIMMLFFLNNFSAGLSYYYLLANVISILQMTVFKRWFIDEEKIRAQLLLNMKTPKKKSRWQQRLEDMQKQQQQTQRNRGRR
ncbi:MAG: membrane protein insertase YidC [Flavobacteriales bacterium]|nr:membrane protein insertase YidC [Flavobacteriales bacterium]